MAVFKELSFDCVYPEFEVANLLYRTLGACVGMGEVLIPGLAMAALVIKEEEDFRNFALQLRTTHAEHPFQYPNGELTALYDQVQQAVADPQCLAILVLKRSGKIFFATSSHAEGFDVIAQHLQELHHAAQAINDTLHAAREADRLVA
jgi:hypothetical protein